MRSIIAATVAGLGLLGLDAASATPVTIVFQNPNADIPSGNYTTGGTCNGIAISSIDLCTINNAAGFQYQKDWASVNVTAYTGQTQTALIQDLAPANSGLGVLTSGETNSDDQVQSLRSESILFQFSSAVYLLGMDFNAGADVNCATPGSEGPCGTFNLFVDGAFWAGYNAIDNLVFPSIAGTLFQIVATGPSDGGFAIGSITVDSISVPEPATFALFGAGLLGFAFARKNKKAA